jgi:hypothetical protein
MGCIAKWQIEAKLGVVSWWLLVLVAISLGAVLSAGRTLCYYKFTKLDNLKCHKISNPTTAITFYSIAKPQDKKWIICLLPIWQQRS